MVGTVFSAYQQSLLTHLLLTHTHLLTNVGKEMVGKVFSAVKNMAPKIINFIKSQDPNDPNVIMKQALAKKKVDEEPPPADVDQIHVENAEAFLLWDINRLLTGVILTDTK